MNQRARTLNMLKQVRKGPVSERERTTAEATKTNLMIRTNGSNYFTASDAREVLREHFVPRKSVIVSASIRRGLRRAFDPKRKALAEKVFSPKENFAILFIRPELFTKRQSLVQTLKLLGVEIKLAKTMTFTKGDLFEMYRDQLFNYNKAHEEFATFGAKTISGPNRLFVVKLPPTFRNAEEKNEALKELKELIRKTYVDPMLRREGITSGEITPLGKALDSTAFIQTKKPNPKITRMMFSGIHIPDAEVTARDAQVFLNSKELAQILKK